MPNVPALAGLPIAGLAGFEAVGWAGLVGPAAMPAAVVERISRDFAQVLAEPALVQRVEKAGSVVRALPGERFTGFIRDEVAKWGAAARASGTRLDG